MAKPTESRKVELTEEQYTALLSRLDEQAEELDKMKKDSKKSSKRPAGDDIDQLLDEAEIPLAKRRPAQKINFDELTNAQLMEAMVNHVFQLLEPALTKLEVISLRNDIRDLKDDGYDMSPENLEGVLTKMKGRPDLTMQEAYHDVVGKPSKTESEKEDPEKDEGEEDESTAKPAKKSTVVKKPASSDETKGRPDPLRHLPPIPGEKPGAPEGNFDDKEPSSLKDAVARAVEDVAADIKFE